MQSRNIIIGVLGVLLVAVAIGSFLWNRNITEENTQNQELLAEQNEEIQQLNQLVSQFEQEENTQNQELLAEQNEEIQQLNQLVSQFEQVEAAMQELKNSVNLKDDTIAALNDQLAQQAGVSNTNTTLQAQIKTLQEELERRKQIQQALTQQAQEEIDKGEIQVSQRLDNTVIRLEEQILFDTGKADLKPSGIEILKMIAEMMQSIEYHELQVEGHADSRPIRGMLKRRFATNWELSAARSIQVVRYLVEKLGVDATRISVAGFGQFRPVAENDTVQNLQLNRRVEFVFRPIIEESN